MVKQYRITLFVKIGLDLSFNRNSGESMKTLKIKGMACQHCVKSVKKALEEIEGISNVAIDLQTGEATFEETRPVDGESSGRRSGKPAMSLAKRTVLVEGMSCAACVRRVEEGLKSLSGVANASVNFATSKAVVEYDPETLDEGAIWSRIEELALWRATGGPERKGPKEDRRCRWRHDLRRLCQASGKRSQFGSRC